MRKATLLAMLFLALCLSHARAQCTKTYHTIESRVARAEAVLLGTIARTTRKVIVPRNGLSKNGVSTIPDGVVEDTLTVTVRETLKGKPVETVTLVARTSVADQRHEQWATSRTLMLWFLGPEPEPGETDEDGQPKPRSFEALRLGPAVEAGQDYLGDTPPIFSRDFTVLKTADEILDRARRFAKDSPKAVETDSIIIPHALAGLCTAPCDANDLVLPVEPSLESTAKRLIQAPEEFLPGQKDLDSLTRAQLRLGGIDLLRHFRSEENTTLLRSLLKDETVFLRHDDDPPKGKTVRTYPLREKAAGILKAWEKPARTSP